MSACLNYQNKAIEKMRYLLSFFLFSLAQLALGQSSLIIEGTILDKETGQAIPYANIYNQTLETGTISNPEGYFKLKIKDSTDQIIITYIGYDDHRLELTSGQLFYRIPLQSNHLTLNEVVVTPEEDDYLFDLLYECKRNASRKEQVSKAFYELKTFHDEAQVELVEGYYNALTRGHDLKALEMKAARLALQPFKNRFFISTESSKALLIHPLFESHLYFPNSPVGPAKKKAKKQFFLYLEKAYFDTRGDSVCVIQFEPRGVPGKGFQGKVWVNVSQKHIQKINLQCNSCLEHPFLPLFSTDSIVNVQLDITKTFRQHHREMVLNHINFQYSIDYKSRIEKAFTSAYSVRTEAVLFVYDQGDPFFIPRMSFKNPDVSDYRKINAMPFNAFFWEKNDEYGMNDRKSANARFFNSPRSMTNHTLFKPNEVGTVGLFETPFVHWSTDRVIFKEMVADTVPEVADGLDKFQTYDLAVKVFMDVNTYGDSTQIFTKTLFDPFETYYRLPIDMKTHCFINIYFDLCEVERRKFQASLEGRNLSQSELMDRYDEFLAAFKQLKKAYFDSVDKGENMRALKRWNKIVKEELGIDNIELYKVLEGE